MTDQQTESSADIDPIAYGIEWLDGVFERMNFDIDVEGELEDGRLCFDAAGADAEVLMGGGSSVPKSIKSIQTLLGAALARHGEKRQVVLDAGGWRDQRAGSLDGVAHQLRDVVAKLGKKVTIAGLDSHERGLVHSALEHDGRVRTQSEGDGIFRKLTIAPTG